MTESAYVRWLITNTVDVSQMPVPEESLVTLKSATVRHRKHKTNKSWFGRLFK